MAVKLYGDDLEVLSTKGKEIEAILNQIPGAADVATEQITGQPVLQIKLDQQQLARHGVPAKVVTDIIESIGSKPLGEVFEGQLRFPLVVRLPERMREGVSGIGSILIPTAAGERLPCRAWPIFASWRARRRLRANRACGASPFRPTSADVISAALSPRPGEAESRFQLPPGRYSYKFGGQFEHLQRARTRLLIVVPVALALILGCCT